MNTFPLIFRPIIRSGCQFRTPWPFGRHLSMEAKIANDHVELRVGVDTTAFKLSHIWLRDHCRCAKCFEPSTNQRLKNICELPVGIRPLRVDVQTAQVNWHKCCKSRLIRAPKPLVWCPSFGLVQNCRLKACPPSITLSFKRGIWFVREFLVCFDENDRDLSECASVAYSNTLKPFHGWVVRGIFSGAWKARDLLVAHPRHCFERCVRGLDVTYVLIRLGFIASLTRTEAEQTKDPVFRAQVKREMTAYIAGIDRCLRSLNKLYARHNLDSSLAD